MSPVHSASCHLIAIACDYLQLLVITCYLELLVTCLGEGEEKQVLDLVQGVCDKSQHYYLHWY